MKTIKNSKDITTLEIGDKVVFGNLEYTAIKSSYSGRYYLRVDGKHWNDIIFKILNINKENFIKNLGIDVNFVDFPETKSLEALTAIVSALFKEYEKQNELPKTWEEFCEKNRAKDGYYISNGSCIICVEGSRNPNTDKNLCTSKQEAEAFLALMQLRQLRKAYVKDWVPNWGCTHDNYSIIVCQQTLVIRPRSIVSHPLTFPTYELANQFLTNFKDLLEIAKPLL